MSDYKIIWKGDPKPQFEQAIRDEITLYEMQDDVGEIVTLTHLTTGDIDGPSVHAYGDAETGNLIAEYHEITNWVSMADLGAD